MEWILAHCLIIVKVIVIALLIGAFYLIYWVRFEWKPREEDHKPYD